MMKNSLHLILIGLITLFSFSCKENNPKPPVPPTEDTSPITEQNKVIYEVNVRNFSAQGNFAGLQKDLPRLHELGVDILWLMPIHPIGIKNRLGSKGSPYSVQDYLKINPDYGTESDFKALITAAHDLKMEIFMDWVANHTAWDNVWVTQHIDYYASQNGQCPYSPNGWTDVVQLDYTNQSMRRAMIDAMKYWVQNFDINGFRCDYATGVPLDFWQTAKTEINAIKPIFWLAEGDNANYMTTFDCDYTWTFISQLNQFGKDGFVPNLKSACNTLFSNVQYANKMRMVFLTNHDINASDGTEFTRFGNYVLPLTVLYFTIYDLPLIYNGQEIGANKVMGLFEINPVPWTLVNPTMSNLFKKLIALKHTQPALESGKNRGTLVFYDTTNPQILVYSRKRAENEVLVILNFSSENVSFNFNSAVPSGTFTDYLKTNTTQEFSASKSVNITANGYAVYVK